MIQFLVPGGADTEALYARKQQGSAWPPDVWQPLRPQVLAGWAMGKPFTLDFDLFSVLMLTRKP